MRTIVRAFLLGLGVLSFYGSFSQQVAKTIPNSSAPEGLIGFLQFTPPDYGSQKHPLIIFLHGIGERGNGTTQINSVTANAIPYYCSKGATMRFTVNGVTSSFVVLSPQLSTQLGYWPPFYVKEMINYAKANLQIDPNRIYVTGLSLGGGGIWRLITDASNWDYSYDGSIAAAAPVCGTQEENDYTFCNTIGANHLPIWAFHSMDDGTVGVGATQHAEILSDQCNVSPAPIFTYYQSGGHGGAWVNAYDTGHITRSVLKTKGGGNGNGNGNYTNFTASPNLYEWLLSNNRGATQQPSYTAPTVNAGAAQSITLPLNTITLSGSASGTNGANIVSYSWTKASGPAGGVITVPLLNISLVTGLVQGTYVFTLTATDNHGLSSSANVTVNVNPLLAARPPANQPPVSSPGDDYSITLPSNSITLNGVGSNDPDGSIVSYKWAQTGGPSTASMNSTSSNIVYAWDLVAGTYTFKLTVTDNAGASASSDVNVTVNPAPGKSSFPNNKPPVSSPGSDYSISLPNSSITLNGIGSYDPDGSISSFKWEQTAGPSTASMNTNTGNLVYAWDLVAGTYSFRLTVTDNNGSSSAATVNVTVNGAAAPPPPSDNQPIAYLRQNLGLWQACGDGATDGRIPIYGDGVANGNVVYLDAARTRKFDGGWNWYSWTWVQGGASAGGLSVFPDGTIHMLSNCGTASQPPVAAPPVTPPAPSNNLLGYIKISVGPYQACDDNSTDGRMAIYGTGIGNGSPVYTDAAMTQKFDGGWNWYSFKPSLNGATTYGFAIYPIGTMGLVRNCGNSSRSAAPATSAEQDMATLRHLKDSAAAALSLAAGNNKLSIYPNPVRSAATLELNSAESGPKTVSVYNTSGVLTAKYIWQTNKGRNVFSLKNIPALPGGLYIADVRDSNGLPVGKLKFVKE